MTKQERAKLQAEVSRLIAGYLTAGDRVTTPQLRDEVFEMFPELIDQEAKRLASQSVSNMIRKILKTASRQESNDLQVSLFGNSEIAVEVPKCIAVPSGDGAREMTWTSIADASLTEIDAYVQFLRKGAKADFHKAKLLDVFRDKVVDLAGDDDLDAPIRDLLQGFRAEKQA